MVRYHSPPGLVAWICLVAALTTTAVVVTLIVFHKVVGYRDFSYNVGVQNRQGS